MASGTADLLDQLNIERRRVDVAVADLTVREVVRMVRDGEMNAAPAYQRKFRWKPADESRLIESLMLGLPVPSVFVAANPDFSLEVVDGLQRVSTLVHFLEPRQEDLDKIGRESPLALSGLDKLEKLEDLTFAQLPGEVQRYFGRLGLRVTTLTDKSDPNVRFQLFERLNRGAVALSPQEVRTVVYRGGFVELLKELAGGGPFRDLVKLQQSQEDDGTRGELVLKFFAYLERFDDYDGRVTEFLNEVCSRECRPNELRDRASATALRGVCRGNRHRHGHAVPSSRVPLDAVEPDRGCLGGGWTPSRDGSPRTRERSRTAD
jgi:hypothetical protein